jgi:hypothetical protein
MDWSAIATSRVNDLTRPRSAGQPINTHVVPSRLTQEPDFERMKQLVHNTSGKPPATRETKDK